MSEFLYSVFIFPLEYLIQMVLESVLNATGNPILSLFAASGFVSIGAMPLYHMAEKWQDDERAIQEKLRPKIIEFKSVFKGANLNAYIQTLYRQNGYHPLYAIRSVVGILIQIPFFFAAYHLLSGYPAFEGVSAFVFDDLGSPDGLIRIGDSGINLLPFIMTGVNILSARIYSKKLGKKEKIQTYVIAGIFLVVLYNASASLLFYWTLNNVFGLIKNAVYRLAYPDGRIRATDNRRSAVSSFWLRIAALKPGAWVQIALFAFCVGFYLIAPEFIKPTSNTANSIYSLIYTVLFVLCVFAIVGVMNRNDINSNARLSRAIIYGIILIVSLMFYGVWMLDVLPDIANVRYACLLSFALLLFEGTRSVFVATSHWVAERDLIIRSRPSMLFYLAVLTLFSTLFIAVPLPLVSTASVGDFDKSLPFYLYYMLALIVSFTILGSVIRSFMDEASQSLLTYIISTAAILSLINAFVFSGDYGDMSNFHFENGLPGEPIIKIMNILVLLSIVAGMVFAFIKGKYKWLMPVLGICLLSIVVVAVSEGHRFHEKSLKIANKSKSVSRLEKKFTFSKTQKNVLVIMLDRFVGGMLPKAFELVPRLNSQFEGFTWYPEYLSDGAFTILGVPSLMGGWEYHTKEIQNKRTTTPLKSKLDESARVLPYNFSKAGYDTTIYADLEAYFDNKNKKYVEKTRFESLKKKYKDLWLKEHKKKLEEDNIRGKLAMFGLFRTAPPFLRKYIYDDGEWLLKSKIENTQKGSKNIIGDKQVSFLTTNDAAINRAVESFSSLYFLRRLSTTSSKAPKQFFYFSNTFTHEPVAANANFDLSIHERIFYPRDIYDEFNQDMYTLQHLYTDTTALVALGKWFEWMKQHDVYDNTRIIILSDHGRNIYNPTFSSQKITSSKNKNKIDASWFHGLLMVKDFGDKGVLKQNDQFMATCDVPWLTMTGIINNPINPSTGNRITRNKNKFPFSMYYTRPMIWHQSKYKYRIKEAFEVKRERDVLDPTKWRRIDVK